MYLRRIILTPTTFVIDMTYEPISNVVIQVWLLALYSWEYSVLSEALFEWYNPLFLARMFFQVVKFLFYRLVIYSCYYI